MIFYAAVVVDSNNCINFVGTIAVKVVPRLRSTKVAVSVSMAVVRMLKMKLINGKTYK